MEDKDKTQVKVLVSIQMISLVFLLKVENLMIFFTV